MQLSCGLMDGLLWDATLQPSTEEGQAGRTVLVLSNEEVVQPTDIAFGEFSLVEATAEERAALLAAGYDIPDWEPSAGPGCASCHGGALDRLIAEQAQEDPEPPGSRSH
jgi:mono/diheme cytochrome c family protein